MTHNRLVWLLLVVVLGVLVLLLTTGIPLCDHRDHADAQPPAVVAPTERLDALELQFRAIEDKTAEVEASGKG